MSASPIAIGSVATAASVEARPARPRPASLPQPSARVLAACRRGDSDAFAWLFQRYRNPVYHLALHVCGDPADAGDITQDVFLKLLTRIGQFREDARFTTWLYRVVLNAAFDHHRARRPVVPLEDLPPPVASGPPPQHRAAEERERRLLVRRAVAALKPPFRAPVVLRYGAELSYEEIAEVLGISKGTVASRLSRGLRDLGRALGKRGAEAGR